MTDQPETAEARRDEKSQSGRRVGAGSDAGPHLLFGLTRGTLDLITVFRHSGKLLRVRSTPNSGIPFQPICYMLFMAARRRAGYASTMEVTPPALKCSIAEGDFYVDADCCLLCGVPESIAPEIFRTGEHHCSIVRQPSSPDELDRTIRAMWSGEVDCVRYRGRDLSMLERLAQAGMSSQADHGNSTTASLLLRDRVSFEMPETTNLPGAVRIASEFRADMRAQANKVLPSLFGRRSVWVSWSGNH